MNSGRFDADSEDILFCGDVNLGVDRGWKVFSACFPRARKLIWQRGTSKAPQHEEIRSRSWLFTISFYNDFIFAAEDFPHLGLPLNLHPSLPRLRGVGHDCIPLIENHGEHGGTLHYMEPPVREGPRVAEGVDTGRIIRICKRALSPTATYGDIRTLNQQIMLGMLAELCAQLLAMGCMATAHHQFCREAAVNGLAWSERYVSYADRERVLGELRQSDPGHRVFNHARSALESMA